MVRKRILSYDLIRITAVFMVVMIHVSAYMVTYFKTGASNPTFLTGNIFNGLGRAGTPMFLMLTGALFLDEKKPFDTKRFFKKSFLPICLLLIFWQILYSAWRALILPQLKGSTGTFEKFLELLLRPSGPSAHLWYLYMLIGAYLAIPILRLFVKKENKSYILGIIILAIVAQFVVQTAAVFTRETQYTVSDYATKLHLEYATGYVPYMLIGWYLTTFQLSKKARLLMIGAGAAAVAFIILIVQSCIDNISDIRDYMVEMNTLPALIYGCGVFTLINSICGKRETKSGLVRVFSSCSFGIYIIHIIMLDLVLLHMPYKVFNEQHPLLYIFILYTLCLVLSFVIVFILTRIKGIRKLFHV